MTNCKPRKIMKKFFLPDPPTQAFTQPSATLGTFRFQLPGELDKESKAKKRSQSSCSSMCVRRLTSRS
jgi:hypothetical protein